MAATPGACQDVGVGQLLQARVVPRVGRRQNPGGYDRDRIVVGMAAAPGACQDFGVGWLPQARVVPRVGRRQNRGGYDCELVVSPPPDAIQAECPICQRAVCY